MNCGISLIFCFLYTVLNFAFSDAFRYCESSVERSLTVQSTGPESVILKWTFRKQEKDVIKISVSSLSACHAVVTSPSFYRMPDSTYYEVRDAQELHEEGQSRQQLIYDEYDGYAIVTVSDLEFPDCEYKFELNRTHYDGNHVVVGTASGCIFASTAPDPLKPRTPPEVGAGFFQIKNVDDTSRTAEVFWKTTTNDDLKSDVSVYEEGRDFAVKVGYRSYRISKKRHHFIFKTEISANNSEDVAVTIPPQDEILPAPLCTLDRSGNITTLSWEKPKNVDVSNYTVFLIDSLDGKTIQRILTFITLPNNENSIKVKNHGPVLLGVSVNTASSSSGIHFLNFIKI